MHLAVNGHPRVQLTHVKNPGTMSPGKNFPRAGDFYETNAGHLAHDFVTTVVVFNKSRRFVRSGIRSSHSVRETCLARQRSSH
jgi:hypothetical protein